LFEEVRTGLESKSLLLQELHHRVKNNMQTIKSLLEMQARRAQTVEAAELLKLSAGRIAGMAQVHDLLSRDDVGLASAGAIIDAMVDLMRTDLAASGREIEVSVEADSVQLTSDKASVFALVVNELLWNALQHGLEDRSSGQIQISAYRDSQDLVVTVADDGRGVPPGFTLESDMGLGLSIVRNLSERNLDGNVSITARDNGPGAVATLKFTP
jgi:two-component sensor histidine kinase